MERDFSHFDTDMARSADKLERYLRDDLPREVGHIGVDHFDESFVDEGFTDERLERWPDPARKNDPRVRGVARTRKTLSGSTSTLKNGNYYETSGHTTDFFNEAEYAHAHNQGSNECVRVKAHTRTRGDRSHRVEAYSYRQNIPQRRFAGPSAQINRTIIKQLKSDFKRILNSH